MIGWMGIKPKPKLELLNCTFDEWWGRTWEAIVKRFADDEIDSGREINWKNPGLSILKENSRREPLESEIKSIIEKLVSSIEKLN